MTHRDTSAISTRIILNAQWTDLDEDIVDEIRNMWRAMDLGNDYYYVQFDVAYEKQEQEEEDDRGFSTPLLIAYLEEHNVRSCLIHWWW